MNQSAVRTGPISAALDMMRDGTRLGVLEVLAKAGEPTTTGQIARELGVEQFTVSHAVAMLRNCQLVRREQDGRKRLYSLIPDNFRALRDYIDATFCGE